MNINILKLVQMHVCTEANAYVDRLFTVASDKHDKPGCVQTWHKNVCTSQNTIVGNLRFAYMAVSMH